MSANKNGKSFMEVDEEAPSNIRIKEEKPDGRPEEKNAQCVDDDPVVREIPVFLSKTMAKNLMLFQVSN